MLMQPIGSGAMSRVYRALRDSDSTVVALKVIATSSDQRRTRFESELSSLKKVCHPGIVHVIDSGQDANWMWLAMDLVDGIPLDDWIGRLSGTTRLRHVLLAGVEIADALTAVHDQGLVHRDLKPANILMTRGGHIKLMDFGFADHVDAPVQAPTAGTLRYMAPERLTGSRGDRRTDLFSLGVVLFELLSRRPPHVGLDHNRLILTQCTEPAPSVAEFAPEVPQQAVDIIDRMLEKPPGQRPRSAQDVADALKQALAQEPRPVNWRPALRISHFVGHKALLENLVQIALSRKVTTVMLHGPPGIGLSRILHELQGRTLLRGAHPVLISGGRRLLFRVLDSLVGPMRPAVLRRALLGTDRDLLLSAWPELSRSTEDVVCLARPPKPIDLVRALQRVLRRAAAQRPLILSIDNADRVDARDLSMLQGAGLLLLATHSPDTLPLPCERVAVPPLERAQLETLAGTMLGQIIGPRLVMENAAMLAGLPGRLVALARGDIPWAPTPTTTLRHRGAPSRPWECAVEAAESALVNRSPTEALAVLAESSPAAAPAKLMYRAEMVRSRAALQGGDIPRARACAITAAAIAPSAPDRSDALLTEADAALRG
ncbi:MAG: serine/threonine-protein kinase PknK, partial [Oligoflexia bacterium]|nr:serine/threonine-protein kinase PknK [Oligoflexia bacterium]